MPVTDSDSDTDWNAQAKILPIRSNSSPSLLHSPHPSSYARNSSQKNLKIFKKDFLPLCDAPDITPEKVQKEDIPVPNVARLVITLENVLILLPKKMRLKTNISIVNSLQTPSELNLPPVPNVSADDVNYDLNIDQTHLPKTVAPDPTDNVLKHSCPFCKKFLSNSSNGRPLLYGSGLKNIFSGKLADTNLETVEKLKSLHPTEHFCPSKPSICQYWLENPFQAHEVLNAVAKLPKGKAAGPSGISFDLLKTACKNAPEIVEDLASYFQNLMCLNYVPPPELTAARLVALVKPGKGDKPDGVRPIAIGESLTRLLSSLIFNRISTKARDYLKPFQFGIKTVEGASVASMTSDVFFNSQQHQYIFNLDFKNAFNSVKRNCIFDVLLHDFPELTAYFYLFYGKKSDLIFDSFTLESSSGVKQGDPLGPLLFCLAIHNIIKMTQQDFPDLRIVAYMDDISIIGSFESISRVSEDIAAKYKRNWFSFEPI
ncbi:hypothetical protein P9112_007188 [Eukaryota sp. TZLM1-RC]